MINVGIIGGAGYTGGELLRILINHPGVNISFVNSKSNAGKYVHAVHQDLIHCDIKFSETLIENVDIIFTCSGHGEALKYLQEVEVPNHIKIIDLGNDFRLVEDSKPLGRSFTYGLPEFKEIIS
jgi:N-acetyl-gamma-glutamyl-phosphate reductase